MAKQSAKQSEQPTAASVIAEIEHSLRARLSAEPGVSVEAEPALAQYRRATSALLLAVLREWPADLPNDEQVALEYVREQASREAEIAAQNATIRAQVAYTAARDHFRAYLDVQRRQQARAARQRAV